MKSTSLYAIAAEAQGKVRHFVAISRVRAALLITSSGQVVAQHGFTRALDVSATATLAAGIHASSGALARLVGARGFHQSSGTAMGSRVFIGSISGFADDLILVAVLGPESTLGLVRIFFDELRAGLAGLDSWSGVRRVDSAPRFESELNAGLARFFR
jgi:predicted regulator of Ras-like GTPase activity (Roadblock/LC7/MglB family)